MTEAPQHDDAPRDDLAQFKALYAASQDRVATGDASIDMLLFSVDRDLASLIEALAVPHWFDRSLAERCGPPATAERFDEVLALPFIRPHPLGYAYHDVVREALRRYLIRSKRDEFVRLSRVCAEAFSPSRQAGWPIDENVKAEWIYHALVADEPAALETLERTYREAAAARRLSLCETLVQDAEEQRPLLSIQGRRRQDYLQGLLALHSRRWDEARRRLETLRAEPLPPELAVRTDLSLGMSLEGGGLAADAVRCYEARLADCAASPPAPALLARLHQRAGEAYLTLGDLKQAEAHTQESLEINDREADQLGQALNRQSLGRIYAALRDPEKAEVEFEAAIRVLEQVGRDVQRANVYADLGAMYLALGRADAADAQYRRALDAKVAAGDHYGVGFIYGNLGASALSIQAYEQARRYFESSVKVFRQFDDRPNSARILRRMADTHRAEGLLDLAAERMGEAIDLLPAESPLLAEYRRSARGLDRARRRRRWRPWVIAVGVVVLLLLAGIGLFGALS